MSNKALLIVVAAAAGGYALSHATALADSPTQTAYVCAAFEVPHYRVRSSGRIDDSDLDTTALPPGCRPMGGGYSHDGAYRGAAVVACKGGVVTDTR